VGLLRELRRVEKRLEEARRLEQTAQDRPTDGNVVDSHAVDSVKVTRERLAELVDQLARAEQDAEVLASTVEDLEGKQRELAAAVDGLDTYAQVDASARDQVQTLWAQLEGMAADEESTSVEVPERDPLLARYRLERDSLRELAGAQRHVTLRRVVWIAVVVLTVGIAWLVRKLVSRLHGAHGGKLQERLAVYGAVSLADLDARVLDEDDRVARAEAVAEAFAQTRKDADERRKSLLGRVVRALDEVGSPAAPLDVRVRAYITAVDRHGERNERVAALERLRGELIKARRPQEERDRLLREHDRAEQQLRSSYALLGIVEDDLGEAGAAFERLILVAEREMQRERDADAAVKALHSLLGGETPETAEQRVDEARRLYDEHCAAQGVLGAQPDEKAQYSEQLAQLELEVRDQIERLTTLDADAVSLEAVAADAAELKENLARVEATISRLEEAKEAVGIARTVLVESADELKKEFAPHLNKALEQNLARITGGRYSEAMVDGSLAVKVVVPETGQLKSADELSRATKDQLFLIQRLEIARLLAPTKGSAPLLLDDPFAHYDKDRLRRGLEVVAEAATERQIILFSEDLDLVEIARAFCGTCGVVELVAPVPE
jgi:uncharacterized protein YhaN